MREELKRYFSFLNEQQLDLYEQFASCFLSWNEKINLISRKDTENLFVHHILHRPIQTADRDHGCVSHIS